MGRNNAWLQHWHIGKTITTKKEKESSSYVTKALVFIQMRNYQLVLQLRLALTHFGAHRLPAKYIGWMDGWMVTIRYDRRV